MTELSRLASPKLIKDGVRSDAYDVADPDADEGQADELWFARGSERCQRAYAEAGSS